MKAFKVRRSDQDYFRVELPKDLFPDGKRRSVMAKTRRAALDKAEELVQKRKKGLKTEEAKASLAEFLTDFCRSTKRRAVWLYGRGRTIGITSMKT